MHDYLTQNLYTSDSAPLHLRQIQQFFITVQHPVPGRSSPNTSLGLTFVGIALLCLSLPERSKYTRKLAKPLAGIFGAGVIGLGTTAIIGYLVPVTTAYVWRYVTGISILTNLALLALGGGIFSIYWRDRAFRHVRQWFPFSIGFGVFTASLVLWQALTSWSVNLVTNLAKFATETEGLLRSLGHTILIAGFLMAVLVVGLVNLAQLAKTQADKLDKLNFQLKKVNSLLETTLESTVEGIVVLNPQMQILYQNSQFIKIWQMPDSILESTRSGSSEQAFPFLLSQVKNPDECVAATQLMLSHLEEETFHIIELKDGRVFERSSRPHWVENRCVGKVLSYRDVTERKQAEDALRYSEDRFHAFMNNSPAVAFMKDQQGRYVYVNQMLEQKFNISFELLQGKTDFDWLPEELAQLVSENDAEVIATGRSREVVETVPAPDGTIYHWLVFKFPFDDNAGSRLVGGVAVDITQRRQLEDALFREKELAQVTLDSIGDAVITTDGAGMIEYLNPVAKSLTGWSQEEVKGLLLSKIFMIVNEITRAVVPNPVDKALQTGKIVALERDTILISKEGDEVAIDDSAAPIRDRTGKVVGAVMVFHDVTETRNLSRQVSWQAMHDSLTSLVNRREFERRLEKTIISARKKGITHVLLYLDLDRFKVVNDTCGHASGDELLRQVTTILKNHIRKTDTLARLGGDEFGVLLNQCSLEQALKIANTLRDQVQAFRFVWQDNTFAIGVSIGLVEINADSQSLANLLIAADSACYAAKNQGRNRVHIFQSNDREVLQQQGESLWVTRITKALDENRFCLHYQPIQPIASPDINTNHYEVLLRLQDEQGKLVSPMAFIPAAERYNLMEKIDRWVISFIFSHWSSIQNYQATITAAKQHICAINLSGSSINDNQFLEFLTEQFALYSIPPQQICFEITETVAIANLTKASRLICQLQHLGCHFALDDFGSGMSSFAYLKNLPVNYLKIDGGFIKNILEDPIDSAMVQAITHVAHVMGIETIAEYVENDAILECIKTIGIDYAQGYGIARPSPLLVL
jgi:diguanylate cyclase (GGDEF)-like protein/PAS domain S-box-containing protein